MLVLSLIGCEYKEIVIKKICHLCIRLRIVVDSEKSRSKMIRTKNELKWRIKRLRRLIKF